VAFPWDVAIVRVSSSVFKGERRGSHIPHGGYVCVDERKSIIYVLNRPLGLLMMRNSPSGKPAVAVSPAH
jgi:hypothetical protein